jgi:hypothetical protein
LQSRHPTGPGDAFPLAFMRGGHSNVTNMHLHHDRPSPMFAVTSKELAGELPIKT